MRNLNPTKMKLLDLDTIRNIQGPPWMTDLPTECLRMLPCCGPVLQNIRSTQSQREELNSSNCDHLGWYGYLSFRRGTLLKAHFDRAATLARNILCSCLVSSYSPGGQNSREQLTEQFPAATIGWRCPSMLLWLEIQENTIFRDDYYCWSCC